MIRNVGFIQKILLLLSIALAMFTVSCVLDPFVAVPDSLIELANKPEYDGGEYIDYIRDILSKGNLNAKGGHSGYTPLQWASLGGYPEIAKALIAAGAALNTKNSDGETALMVAARRDEGEIAEALINAGADLNIQNDLDRTALINAGHVGSTEIVELLVNAGADKTLEDKDGETAYKTAKVSPFVDEADKPALLELLDFEGNPDK